MPRRCFWRSYDRTIRRTLRAGRRCRCGLPWNRHEIELLSQLYADHSDGELAAKVGRSEWAVRGKARALGLVRDPEEYAGYHAARDSRPWSPAEVDLLQRLHRTSPYEEIADLIGRTRNAVHLKARKPGLRKMQLAEESGDSEPTSDLPMDELRIVCISSRRVRKHKPISYGNLVVSPLPADPHPEPSGSGFQGASPFSQKSACDAFRGSTRSGDGLTTVQRFFLQVRPPVRRTKGRLSIS